MLVSGMDEAAARYSCIPSAGNWGKTRRLFYGCLTGITFAQARYDNPALCDSRSGRTARRGGRRIGYALDFAPERRAMRGPAALDSLICSRNFAMAGEVKLRRLR